MSAGISIVMIECRAAASGATTLEGRIKAAFKSACNHWMVLDDNQRFQGAVAAVWDLSDDETKSRIEGEMKSLRTLSAICSGVPVDFAQIETPQNPIGLLGKWHEQKEAR